MSVALSVLTISIRNYYPLLTGYFLVMTSISSFEVWGRIMFRTARALKAYLLVDVYFCDTFVNAN